MADKIVHSNQVLRTENYDKFKHLPGNRPIDWGHVNRLASKIEREGNLTPEFPIDVNENLEILDGQHRLEALRLRKEPVYYQIKKGLNIDSVTSLNTGQKNWTWKDFAHRYATAGNQHYAQFLKLAGETGETRFGTVFYYATLGTQQGGNRSTSDPSSRDYFNGGHFVMRDYELSLKLLGQYQELVEVSGVSMREFSYAALKYMRTPSYNHEQMVDKIAAYGYKLNACYTIGEFISTLDEIYKA